MYRFAIVYAALFCSVQSAIALDVVIIGNSNYKDGNLPNPLNDAKRVREIFGELPIRHIADGTKDSIAKAVAALAGKPDVFLLFSGHGFRVANHDYIVPIDGKADPDSCISVQSILDQLKGCKRKVLIFDCCRTRLPGVPLDRVESLFFKDPKLRPWAEKKPFPDKPQFPDKPPFPDKPKFPDKPQFPNGEFGEPDLVALHQALDKDGETILWYSTSPNKLAYDGPAGGNSPFIRSWLESLAKRPGTSLSATVEKLFSFSKLVHPPKAAGVAGDDEFQAQLDRIVPDQSPAQLTPDIIEIQETLRRTNQPNEQQRPHVAVVRLWTLPDGTKFTTALHITEGGIGVGGGRCARVIAKSAAKGYSFSFAACKDGVPMAFPYVK